MLIHLSTPSLANVECQDERLLSVFDLINLTKSISMLFLGTTASSKVSNIQP